MNMELLTYLAAWLCVSVAMVACTLAYAFWKDGD